MFANDLRPHPPSHHHSHSHSPPSQARPFSYLPSPPRSSLETPSHCDSLFCVIHRLVSRKRLRLRTTSATSASSFSPKTVCKQGCSLLAVLLSTPKPTERLTPSKAWPPASMLVNLDASAGVCGQAVRTVHPAQASHQMMACSRHNVLFPSATSSSSLFLKGQLPSFTGLEYICHHSFMFRLQRYPCTRAFQGQSCTLPTSSVTLVRACPPEASRPATTANEAVWATKEMARTARTAHWPAHTAASVAGRDVMLDVVAPTRELALRLRGRVAAALGLMCARCIRYRD
jgi:hypothetical protein